MKYNKTVYFFANILLGWVVISPDHILEDTYQFTLFEKFPGLEKRYDIGGKFENDLLDWLANDMSLMEIEKDDSEEAQSLYYQMEEKLEPVAVAWVDMIIKNAHDLSIKAPAIDEAVASYYFCRQWLYQTILEFDRLMATLDSKELIDRYHTGDRQVRNILKFLKKDLGEIRNDYPDPKLSALLLDEAQKIGGELSGQWREQVHRQTDKYLAKE